MGFHWKYRCQLWVPWIVNNNVKHRVEYQAELILYSSLKIIKAKTVVTYVVLWLSKWRRAWTCICVCVLNYSCLRYCSGEANGACFAGGYTSAISHGGKEEIFSVYPGPCWLSAVCRGPGIILFAIAALGKTCKYQNQRWSNFMEFGACVACSMVCSLHPSR